MYPYIHCAKYYRHLGRQTRRALIAQPEATADLDLAYERQEAAIKALIAAYQQLENEAADRRICTFSVPDTA